MAAHFPLVFSSPRLLQIASAMVALTVVIAIARRLQIRRLARGLILSGAILLAVAAGKPLWNQKTHGSIAVMVDLSPSTRGATFRDRAALDMRIHQLLGEQPHETYAFSDRNQPLGPTDALTDMPADQTIFSPPVADAILLFSDGQFSLPPIAPPTFPVIDPTLDHPGDVAVTNLKSIGNHVLATVSNQSPSRILKWTNAIADQDEPALATPTGVNQITASISPGDYWPENDLLSLNLPPPQIAQSWWIGSSPPTGWRQFSASSLSTDPADFLQPAIIVLNNISADELSSAQQQRLLQYVRDLGGSLLIVGGNHAFAAGNYDASLLENLSPLSSSPPLPAHKWLLLIDGSGSMAGDPWQNEIVAISRLIPQLPPHDPITLASFARSLSLWPTHTVPSNIYPTGPTNLAPALQQITTANEGSIPTQLLLMTDAETDLPDPEALAAALKTKNIHLYLLAIGNGRALAALKTIANVTGGLVLEQLDPRQWINSARQLLRSALPDHLQYLTVPVRPAPPSTVSMWNQTWLKPAATQLQQSTSAPMTARWQLGVGQVTAIAYPADLTIVQSFANQIAMPPRDPRFKVTWDADATLHVSVDAVDNNQYLNGEAMSLEMGGTTAPLPQTAPGKYQISMPAPRSSRIVTVRRQNQVLERFAIAGRYPPEFNAIGNDLENLKMLAARTGGSMINPGPVQPIDFRWPIRQTPLSSEFAFAGFILIGAGMIWNKRFHS